MNPYNPYSRWGLLASSSSFQRMLELYFKSIPSHCYQFIIDPPLAARPFKLAQWYQTTGVTAGVGQLRLQINWFSEEVTAPAFKAQEMRKINYRTSGIVGVSVRQEEMVEMHINPGFFGGGKKTKNSSQQIHHKNMLQVKAAIVYFSTHWRQRVG